MFAPRFRSAFGPTSNCAARCLRQHREALARKPIWCQMRQQRHQSTRSFWASTKILWKANPVSVTGGFAVIFLGALGIVYVNYYYNTYIIGAFHKFPEPVAKELRKALYYTNMSVEPKKAVKYYREALRVADEMGMDPFSDEIIGVKIQLAYLMEKVQQYHKAIDILEIVRSDNLKWIDVLGGKEGNEGKRTKVLGMTVGVTVKLGELFSNQYVDEQELAEERLVWAVETVLKELHRREKEGVKPEEGEWMSPESIGGTLEALAHKYEEKDLHHLAAPLFLQCLTLSSPNSCHTAVLMNNLSISLAQQNPPPTPNQAPVSQSALISNARQWAEKSLEISAKIVPPDRTEECDRSCAVATYNLASFAEMEGNISQARKLFQEAKSLAKAIQFDEGVTNAEEGLKRLAEN